MNGIERRMLVTDAKNKFKETFLLLDDMILDVIVAVAVATRMSTDPIWLMIIGGSSGGKTELVNISTGIDYCTDVSTLTENTFLSGMTSGKGEETSLLHRIGSNGLVVMKDYTSILTMRPEKREVIVGQLREIFDGHISKMTGNGNSTSWSGKINVLAAVTDAVYLKDGESASMGRRMICYVLPNFDDKQREELSRKSIKNTESIKAKRDEIKETFRTTIKKLVDDIPASLPDLPEDFTEDLIKLSNFMTKVRTPVARDFKGNVTLDMSYEAPMRALQQLFTLARVLSWMNDGATPEVRRIVYKIGMDSIPKDRLIPLEILTRFVYCTTRGAAQYAHYPTERMGVMLEDLDILRIVKRQAIGEDGANKWLMAKDYREIMAKFTGIPLEECGLERNDNYDTDGTGDVSRIAVDPDSEAPIMRTAMSPLDMIINRSRSNADTADLDKGELAEKRRLQKELDETYNDQFQSTWGDLLNSKAE